MRYSTKYRDFTESSLAKKATQGYALNLISLFATASQETRYFRRESNIRPMLGRIDNSSCSVPNGIRISAAAILHKDSSCQSSSCISRWVARLRVASAQSGKRVCPSSWAIEYRVLAAGL